VWTQGYRISQIAHGEENVRKNTGTFRYAVRGKSDRAFVVTPADRPPVSTTNSPVKNLPLTLRCGVFPNYFGQSCRLVAQTRPVLSIADVLQVFDLSYEFMTNGNCGGMRGGGLVDGRDGTYEEATAASAAAAKATALPAADGRQTLIDVGSK